MKTMKRILVIFTAVILLLSMVSCGDKSGAIKKAFEDDGWTVKTVKADDTGVKVILELLLTDEQIEKAADYEIILCNKNIIKNAVVIKFPSSGDVKDFLTVEDEDGKKNTEAYEKAKEDGLINGNCLLITVDADAKKIFK